MAKSPIFSIFFFILLLGYTSVWAKGENSRSFETETCNAPAPDSFRVVNFAGAYVNLAWQPVWVGAKHTLEVLRKNISGNWEPIDTFFNISGSSFAVPNIQYGFEYRFNIATNCVNGEPSQFKSTADLIALIIELSMAGRTPINPVPLEECTEIDYLAHNWVGFKVSRNGTNLGPTNLNYFEFKTRLQGESLIPVLKRDIDEPHIIATDEGFNFPKDPSPLTVDVPGFLPVKIYKFKGGIFEPIGGVFLTHNSQNHTIKFCIENPVHWNPNYSFSVLTATSATGLYEAESRDSSNEHNISELKIKENPFSETITINNIPSSSNMGILSVKLINMLGRIQYSYNYENYQNEISIPTAFISPGTYFIQVQYSNKTQIFKLIKQN